MSIRRLQDWHPQFTAAFNAGARAAILAMYDPAAKFIPAPGQEASGHDAIGQVLDQFLALGGTMHMTTTYLVEAGDTAVARSHWRLTDGKGPDGQPVSMEGHSIEVLCRQADGTWHVLIDSPFGASPTTA